MKTITLNEADVFTGNLILINSKHPIALHHRTELVSANENYLNVLMERSAATVLTHILNDMSCNNRIVPVSGYRSQKEQEQIYEYSLKENGFDFTNKYIALPSCSEHQSGYAIDLALKKKNIDFIRPDFPYSGICDKFRLAAPKYGLIQRYQENKQAITGIAHEPWHFRFVGYPHSEIISAENLSLEEYIEFIKSYTLDTKTLKIFKGNAIIEIFYAPAEHQQINISLPQHCLCQTSGNNVDGFIITLWRQ